MSKNIATGDLESKPFSAEWARLSTPPELMGAMHRHVASSTVMMAASHRH